MAQRIFKPLNQARINRRMRVYNPIPNMRLRLLEPGCARGSLSALRDFASYVRSSSGTLPPFSASFCITCLCSQIFIDAELFVSPP